MPRSARPPTPRNKILAALPTKEYNRLLPHLKLVTMPVGETLYETEDRIKYVYFVNGAVVSLVTHMEEGTSVEVGLVGNEGMVGLSVVMGDDISQNHAVVQISDGAMRMGTGSSRKNSSAAANCEAFCCSIRWRCSSKSPSRRPATAIIISARD